MNFLQETSHLIPKDCVRLDISVTIARGVNTALRSIIRRRSRPSRMNIEYRSGIFGGPEHGADVVSINFGSMPQLGVAEYTAGHDVRQSH